MSQYKKKQDIQSVGLISIWPLISSITTCLMTRLLPKARATFRLQNQHLLPSPPSTYPAQQPVLQQQRQQQQDQEGQETWQEDDTMDVLQADPLERRLAAFYAIHNPRKLLDPSFVIDCADRYQDDPNRLEQILVSHYQVGLRSLTQQQEHQEQKEQKEQQEQPSSTAACSPVLSESVLAIRMSTFYSLHNPFKLLHPQWILDLAEDMQVHSVSQHEGTG